MQRTRGADHCAVLDVVLRFLPIFKLYSKYESKCDLVIAHLEASFQTDAAAGTATREALCAYLEEMYAVQTAVDAPALVQVLRHHGLPHGPQECRVQRRIGVGAAWQSTERCRRTGRADSRPKRA